MRASVRVYSVYTVVQGTLRKHDTNKPDKESQFKFSANIWLAFEVWARLGQSENFISQGLFRSGGRGRVGERGSQILFLYRFLFQFQFPEIKAFAVFWVFFWVFFLSFLCDSPLSFALYMSVILTYIHLYHLQPFYTSLYAPPQSFMTSIPCRRSSLYSYLSLSQTVPSYPFLFFFCIFFYGPFPTLSTYFRLFSTPFLCQQWHFNCFIAFFLRFFGIFYCCCRVPYVACYVTCVIAAVGVSLSLSL